MQEKTVRTPRASRISVAPSPGRADNKGLLLLSETRRAGLPHLGLESGGSRCLCRWLSPVLDVPLVSSAWRCGRSSVRPMPAPGPPPTRRGCGAAAGAAVAALGRRGGAGHCSGLAPRMGARSPAARAAHTGLGVGSVAVTQIAILTLRERHRQGGGRWSGWDAGALVPSFGNFPRGPCPPCSCTTAAAKPAVSWTPEHGQGCDLLPSHSSCSLGLRALRTNCQQFSLPVSPGLPQLPPRGVAAAPCCPQDTATPAAWRSWASVNHPWLIPR